MAPTALDEWDRAGLLKIDSPIQYLGLVIGILTVGAKNMEDCEFDNGETSWVPDVVGYASRANIDLRQMPIAFIVAALDRLSDNGHNPLTAVEGPAKADHWGWKKTV